MTLPRLPQSERIADAVYQSLLDAIFAGTLAPGTRLSVPALAKSLDVSRSPVREAVLRLIQDRIAVEEPRRGAVVSSVGTSELTSLYQVREVLEGLAARLAAQAKDVHLVAELEEILASHREAVRKSDLPAHTQADLDFHKAIRDASGNPDLVAILDAIRTRVRLAMVTTSVTAGPSLALADHEAVFEAIKKGNASAAEKAARAHIARLRTSLAERSSAS